ncbi:hypothetical protein PCC7805_00678 [Planktothrix agardhii]|jgi:hypothetical protein|uniref:Uncharacterized protein n=1 Tax=Planktothrix agardhii TaxID=1160 RepID=A0A1J1JKW7_PLAAG|nr:DUF1802 family protein [Planktothrix agardhii]MCF3576361.1 DUF1802 family protein [Planktothrix agardhii 1812]MCF3579816.1 DUF1802 family protein [Planktothrix agardhii 1811]CAD5921173.1 hypothetical protein PCC7805_00678 [Planktothrix agardhii]CAD5927307.1 hypothetical protein NO365_01064 [Planktothrix agardhii]CUM61623.1 conserved protein of unknown function [Planktothrix agardhii]
METVTNYALKEWDIAIQALEMGETIMLLRKGGIREQGGKFKVDHDKILLYPTFEHQKPTLLKPEYANLVQPVASGWHPETVKISSFAEITNILSWNNAQDESLINSLIKYHIWNQAFVRDRLQFEPDQPLYILLLRTYKLEKVYNIAYHPSYGGCRSWIDLKETISLENMVPILMQEDYDQQVSTIDQILQPS